MSREERRLQNRKQDNVAFLNYIPSSLSMKEGETVEAIVNGRLREYKKRKGLVFYKEYVLDGNERVERSLDIGTDLKIGRIRTESLQPSFLAYNSANDSNFAINTDITVDFNTEVFDIGSNFSSDTFTAPKTGKYFLHTNVRLASVDIDASWYYCKIKTSNRAYQGTIIDPEYTNDLLHYAMQCTAVADMEKDDTAYVVVRQAGGAQQTDIYGTNSPQTYFCGYLLG